MSTKTKRFKNAATLLFLSLLIGLLGGIVGGIFSNLIALITNIRSTKGWLILLLPAVGVLIVFIYKKLGIMGVGTDHLLKSVNEKLSVNGRLTIGIFVAAAISHLFGASVGREGAALQIGGGLAAFISKKFNLNEDDTKTLIKAGMAAVFAAVFGTPLAAFFFALEVAEVFKIRLKAIFPCLLASVSGSFVAILVGAHPERFWLSTAPVFSGKIVWQLAVLSLLCALLAVLFCNSLHLSKKLAKKLFKNPYIRIIAGGVLIVLLTILVGNQDYNGAGIGVIERIFAPKFLITNSINYHPFAFALKLIFTCIAVSAGFKGGEIVPTLFIGATFGALMADLIGMPTAFGAAMGMILLFCGVTNCPLASICLSFELFSGVGFWYFVPCVAVVFILSGKVSLYHEQKYPKTITLKSIFKGEKHLES